MIYLADTVGLLDWLRGQRQEYGYRNISITFYKDSVIEDLQPSDYHNGQGEHKITVVKDNAFMFLFH
jgi:hypothetical protein